MFLRIKNMKVSLCKTIVNYFKDKIEYGLTIVDTYGIVTASTDEAKIGSFNEFAYELILSRQAGNSPRKIQDTASYLGTVPGVCCTFQYDGEIDGAIILEGDSEELFPLINLMRISIEAMCNRNFQSAISSENINIKKQFTSALIYNSEQQATLLYSWAQQLGFDLLLPRVPVLIDCSDQNDCFSLTKMLKLSLSQQDIITEPQENQFFVFKTLPASPGETLKNYHVVCEELSENITSFLSGTNHSVHLFIGNILEQANDFSYGCHLCFWLYTRCASENIPVIYIYDHLNSYLFQKICNADLDRLFHTIYKQYAPEFIQKTIRVIESLDRNNYNLTQTSDALFIHKNTLLSTLDKIRALTGTDPVHHAADRKFLLAMTAYFKEKSFN